MRSIVNAEQRVRHVLERSVGTYQSIVLSPQDAAVVLVALLTAEHERDQARADLKRIADRLCREDEEYAAKVAYLAQKEADLDRHSAV